MRRMATTKPILVLPCSGASRITAPMQRNVSRSRGGCPLVVLVVWTVALSAGEASAACLIERTSSANERSLVKHLGPECTPAEREAHAVNGTVIMEAIANGRPVDLKGVHTHGDLVFDGLPVEKFQMPKGLTSEQREALNRLDVEEHRLVRQAVRIRDSVVHGALRHRSSKGTLQFEGPVDFHGTTFKEGVDLSRSVFQAAVDLSASRFEKEAYFVQGQFAQALRCKETEFGPHTRFHRSVVRGPVDCSGALFNGMAEFLEVTFEQSVTFERARFGLGTGFSGSRFKLQADFSEAIFSREAFFGFSIFEGKVLFADAQFLGSADFSSAEFKQPDDFAKVRFDQPPVLVGTKRVTENRQVDFLESPTGHYALTSVLLVLAAILVAYAVKLK